MARQLAMDAELVVRLLQPEVSEMMVVPFRLLMPEKLAMVVLPTNGKLLLATSAEG